MTPIVRSFLIADAVIQDRLTGKWSVVGVFDRILGPSFPCIHPTVAIYVKLADAQGRYTVKIEFRDSADRVVLACEGIAFEAANPLEGVQFGVTTQGLPLEKPGRYQFQLYLNGEYAAAAPLEVLKLEPRPPAPPA